MHAIVACESKPPAPAKPTAAPKPSQPKPTVSKPSAVVQGAVQKQLSSSSARNAALQNGNQFDFSTNKDPFKPFIVKKESRATKGVAVNANIPGALPIHSFDVSQFKLIGVITGARENKAMVTDPANKGYVLKVGMLIGKNNGRVVAINNSGVEIVELFKDEAGKARKEHTKLTLPRKQ